MNVLDASALLAFLHDETGAEVVGERLVSGSRCSVVNWAEAMQKVLASGRDWRTAAAYLDSFSLLKEPVTLEDAEWAAARWRRGENLSLADRLCLALGERLEASVWTADREWRDFERVRLIR